MVQKALLCVMLLIQGVYSKNPLDEGVSNSVGAWGNFIQEELAKVIWPLVVYGHTIHAWKTWLGQWSTWEWSCWAVPYPYRGTYHSAEDWYAWYSTHEHTWSSLSWTLHFLGLSPLRILRLVRRQLDRVWSRL